MNSKEQSIKRQVPGKVEPYVIVADIYAEPPHAGRGGWSWYSGSAAGAYRLGIELILGVHKEGECLNSNP